MPKFYENFFLSFEQQHKPWPLNYLSIQLVKEAVAVFFLVSFSRKC